MSTADEDWVDVAEEFCGPEEWVVLVGDEGSMAAVFFGRAAASIGAGVAAPIPIVVPGAARSFGRELLASGGTAGHVAAPAPISIAGPGDAIAASRGRVLLSAPWSRYYVLDASAGERHALPRPRRGSSHDAAIACDASGVYWVVRASRGYFEIYASSTGAWSEVPSAMAAGVVPGSAASFAGCVFWKLAASGGILALDIASGTTREIAPPPRCSDDNPAALWQLGVAAGHLCAAVRTDDGIELHGLGPGAAPRDPRPRRGRRGSAATSLRERHLRGSVAHGRARGCARRRRGDRAGGTAGRRSPAGGGREDCAVVPSIIHPAALARRGFCSAHFGAYGIDLL